MTTWTVDWEIATSEKSSLTTTTTTTTTARSLPPPLPSKMPRSVHADAGDAAFTNRRSCGLVIFHLCFLALVLGFLIILPWFYTLYDLPEEFAVQLVPANGRQQGLNVNTSSSSSAAADATTSTSAFHATLHAINRRATERCYHHGDAAVTYGGFTVASGRVPGFCVPRKGRLEVPFVARTDAGGVMGLPEHLRDRATDEAGKVGALELEVQIGLFQHGLGSAASSGGTPSRRMWCTARVGSRVQPPEVAMCTVFALQNWFDFDA